MSVGFLYRMKGMTEIKISISEELMERILDVVGTTGNIVSLIQGGLREEQHLAVIRNQEKMLSKLGHNDQTEA